MQFDTDTFLWIDLYRAYSADQETEEKSTEMNFTSHKIEHVFPLKGYAARDRRRSANVIVQHIAAPRKFLVYV